MSNAQQSDNLQEQMALLQQQLQRQQEQQDAILSLL